MKRNKKVYFGKGDDWKGKSLKDVAIYPTPDYIRYGRSKYIELGSDGYWLEVVQSRHAVPWYNVNHRHDNGKSVSVNDVSQCCTCREYMPNWVKGTVSLIKWSMEDEKAQGSAQE